MGEEVNGVTDMKSGISEVFITLPFDEGICFDSSIELLDWIKEDKNRFEVFISAKDNNVSRDIIYPIHIASMISKYHRWYEILQDLATELYNMQFDEKSNIFIVSKNKIEDFIRTCTEFSGVGFFPMQCCVGITAIAMNLNLKNTKNHSLDQISALPQGIAWLYSMMLFRKLQLKHELTTLGVNISLTNVHSQFDTIERCIEEAQVKIRWCNGELEKFQKNALKSAALKSPANALGDLEKVHKNTALGYFGLIAVIVAVWISFVIFCYYPLYIKPLLDNVKDAPLEAGAMILTGMVFTGIVLTVVIILLRLAVSRINFSISAGERKAMATAFRALLDENAIQHDQQLVFLQCIVGSKLPDFASCNDIRMPVDELAKIIQATSDAKKG